MFKKIAARRQFLFDYLRQELLFALSKFIRSLFNPFPKAIKIGKDVRIQRLKSLRVETPNAAITIGDHSIVYENARIESFGSGLVSIGSNSILGDVKISCRNQINIGDRFLTSWNVFIQDYDSHPIQPELRSIQVKKMTAVKLALEEINLLNKWQGASEPITIGDDVWIGAGVTILKGVKIGKGSLVAAGSVVTRGDYPERSIIAGNPAKVVKQIEGHNL